MHAEPLLAATSHAWPLCLGEEAGFCVYALESGR